MEASPNFGNFIDSRTDHVFKIDATAADGRWALHARAMQRGVLPVVPAGCVVEVWRGGRQPNLALLLDGCEVEALSLEQAKRAGTLRRTMPETVGPIDATVAEIALRRGGAVITSDRSDIELLASAAHRRIQLIDI